VRRLRGEGVDGAVDMEGLTRSSAIITYLTGASQRAGYYNFSAEGPYRGRLFTHEVSYGFQRHVSLQFLALVRAFSADRQVPFLKEHVSPEQIALPCFEPSAQEKTAVRDIVGRRAGAGLPARLVLLNPNCSDLLPLRRWPTENFITVGRRLLRDHADVGVAITGAPSEREEAERIAAEISGPPRAFSMAGHTTLRQLLTLYHLGCLLLSNDSGPCHFAALTPIHVVALFGPETPVLYAPLGRHATAITADFACSPCVNILNHRFSPCTDNRCMPAITVDRVYEAISFVLDRQPQNAE
jgi:ADP-heptose:LPS heptosyltransferase